VTSLTEAACYWSPLLCCGRVVLNLSVLLPASFNPSFSVQEIADYCNSPRLENKFLCVYLHYRTEFVIIFKSARFFQLVIVQGRTNHMPLFLYACLIRIANSLRTFQESRDCWSSCSETFFFQKICNTESCIVKGVGCHLYEENCIQNTVNSINIF
jgi:hypothetical protein